MIELIKKEFKKYNWGQIYSIKIESVYVSVFFKDCEISFFHNQMYKSVECFLYNRKDSKNTEYHLSSVLEHNNVDRTALLNEHSCKPIIEYIEQFVAFLHNDLIHVVMGDFSWAVKEKERRANVKLFADVLGNYSFFELPAFKKMMRGEEGWEDDLMEYVKLKDLGLKD